MRKYLNKVIKGYNDIIIKMFLSVRNYTKDEVVKGELVKCFGEEII